MPLSPQIEKLIKLRIYELKVNAVAATIEYYAVVHAVGWSETWPSVPHDTDQEARHGRLVGRSGRASGSTWSCQPRPRSGYRTLSGQGGL
jgi:hypothetical protein